MTGERIEKENILSPGGDDMNKITLTCKDSGKFFHGCIDCKHYKKCTYFGKNETKEINNEKSNSNKKAN